MFIRNVALEKLFFARLLALSALLTVQVSQGHAASNEEPVRDLLAEDEKYQKRVKALKAQRGQTQQSSVSAKAVVLKNTSKASLKNHERACKDLGWVPNTGGFATCVGRRIYDDTPSTPTQQITSTPSTAVNITQTSPSNEQTCVSYNFKRGTQAFGQCLMQLDQILQQAMQAERQHQLQLAQYQQQVAAYEEQQRAIKQAKKDEFWSAVGRLGAGMANSTSPSFLGALNEGLAAANGYPIAKPSALPPSPPAIQNYTIRGPNGDQIYCSYNTASRYINCR